MTEILAPAGSLENVYAAIDAGADAIYLGGKQFNARKFAHNLDDKELVQAVKTAHLFAVRIYVTVNILMADVELKELSAYLKKLDDIGVDGIIVQDLAVAALAHKVAPDLPLHGSTQQTVADINGVRFLESLGFTQVVLARELSVKEIQEICSQAKAKIEVFIHGAECVCYSGQCLMSSFIGGRSGNRGACAQPCRLAYTLREGTKDITKNDTYLLSLKDLNSLDCINGLIAAGVSSFKIEGRMKGSGYVQSVVSAYRKVVDSHLLSPQEQKHALTEAGKELMDSFNRGYQADFLADTVRRQTVTETMSGNRGIKMGKTYRIDDNIAEAFLDADLAAGDMVKIIDKSGQECVDELQSVTEGALLNGKRSYILEFRRDDLLQGTIYRLSRKADRGTDNRGMARKISLYFHIDTVGDRLRLTVWDEAGHTAEEISDYKVQMAVKRPATAEWVHQQIDRLGDTVFKVADVTIWDENHMIPASVLNALRRDAVEKIEQAILSEYIRPVAGMIPEMKRSAPVRATSKKPELVVRCDSLNGLEEALLAGADRVVYGGDSYDHHAFTAEEWRQAVSLAHKAKVPIWAASPRILRQRNLAAVKKELSVAAKAGVDGIYAGALGIFPLLGQENINIPVNTDWSLNIFNSEAAQLFSGFGCTGLTLSTELTLRQIRFVAQHCETPLEVLVQGRHEMMVMENCPISSFAGSGSKSGCKSICREGKFSLKDRREELFPLVTDQYCRNHILNSRDLDMVPYYSELAESGLARLRIEARGRNPQWIRNQVARYRRLCDGKENMLFSKSDNTVTRGHFFHGIL